MERSMKPERKQEILSAAIDLFGEKGFSRTPTSLIAQKAKVAEGLIFHYFKNKKGILVQILNDIVEEYLEGLHHIADDPGLTGIEAIEQFLRFHFRLREQRSKAFLVLNRELISDIIPPGSAEFRFLMEKWNAILFLFRKTLLKGQQDGSIRDLPVDETALILRGILMGISNLYRQILNISNIQAVSGEAVHFICRSLTPSTQYHRGE